MTLLGRGATTAKTTDAAFQTLEVCVTNPHTFFSFLTSTVGEKKSKQGEGRRRLVSVNQRAAGARETATDQRCSKLILKEPLN